MASSKERARAKASGVPIKRSCGAMTVHQRLLEINPQFRARQANLEHATLRRMGVDALAKKGDLLTIPVVVHVVYKTEQENISLAQIKSQIAVLNKDYRATNPDKSKTPAVWKGLVADARVQFVLATKDPQGKATTGITRTKTTRSSFTDDDLVKFTAKGGINAWNTKKYLNIWVCNLKPWLGYAQFPGGPAKTDGVVILHKAFGKGGTAAVPGNHYNLGRTATHEVGHWLNLKHIWGDTEDCSGGDGVADTPNAETPNYGKPTFPHVSCSNGPNGDMFMNYMDYVDDAAMFMFTTQQVSRIQAALAGPRSAIGA